ncbi:MAG TPA: zinc ribbon domain-containing protein [Terriglobia bacterium]|jgi:putative FmdB family regulatory protein|nr:zinc ribbon domain-containing protein [Terriglobia bacterium]
MPIFEYRCRDCGSKFEKLLLSQAEPVRCQRCQSSELERLLSVFAVSGSSGEAAASESGPCPCGAPRRGMCGE